MTYTIDRNVPAPSTHACMKYRFPFDSMEIGDSFFVSLGDPSRAERVRMHGAVYTQARRRGLIITTRKEAGGMRVWLIGRNGGPTP